MNIELGRGTHDRPEDGMCLLEAVSFVAGEEFSDHPHCVCPVLAAFGRTLNDGMPDTVRTEYLAPLIPKLIGTRSSPEVELRRAEALTAWAEEVAAPLSDVARGLAVAGVRMAVFAAGRGEADPGARPHAAGYAAAAVTAANDSTVRQGAVALLSKLCDAGGTP